VGEPESESEPVVVSQAAKINRISMRTAPTKSVLCFIKILLKKQSLRADRNVFKHSDPLRYLPAVKCAGGTKNR
jgi:hypothetical protein